MSAKRELSSTLKNLKFMQRAVKKEEKPPEPEEKPAPPTEFGFTTRTTKKCIVIMEGNPHPGVVKGRMSFQNFNPSIDKLSQEDSGSCRSQPTTSGTENLSGEASCRLDNSSIASPNHLSDVELKRKLPETQSENLSYDTNREYPRPGAYGQSSESRRDSGKQRKREKLDYNVLRRQKFEAKRH